MFDKYLYILKIFFFDDLNAFDNFILLGNNRLCYAHQDKKNAQHYMDSDLVSILEKVPWRYVWILLISVELAMQRQKSSKWSGTT